MTRRLALAGCVLAASAAFTPPATAAPCDGMTVPQCISPVIRKLQHLCFPPEPDDLYGC